MGVLGVLVRECKGAKPVPTPDNVMFRKIFVSILLGPCAASMALAIGDSGGCLDLGRQPLGKALREGTPQDVDAAILQRVDHEAPRFSLTYSREQGILNLIQASYKKPPPCAPNALLYYALDAGNAEVVRHLVGTPLGVKPRVPPYVLFSCNTQWNITPETRAARRRAYAVLFERNLVDVHATRNGASALAVCKEPELVSLYLEQGARPDVDLNQASERINYLEMAMLDALQIDEDSHAARWLHALERIKLFSQYMPASIEGRPFQSHIRKSCSLTIGGKPWNPKTCEALQTLVRGAPALVAEEK